ncbi:MAG: hypothetical protein P1U57_13520, partial [Oleibacter sp.]|nr:hypothetical protein [Thalassolituus sp.]
MKIESINVAKPVTFMFNDEMVETGLYKTPVKDTVEIHTLGVAGDTIVDQSVHGGIDQAVYMYH